MKVFLKKYRKWIIGLGIAISSIIALIAIANYHINSSTDSYLYDDITKLPNNRVALLLGTSKKTRNGSDNQYFQKRIKAATELYKSGKIEFIVVSGDNSRKEYNEPLDMMVALVMNGIPSDKIYLDYAGFRTFDSVVRMNKIFGQSKFTIISQDFHNRRAIYIARSTNMEAIGYNADPVTAYTGFKTNMRELVAKLWVFIDLAIDKQPKFLGERIEIK